MWDWSRIRVSDCRKKTREYVEFLDGLSQGCPSGSPLTMLALHLAMHITLSKHPDLEVRILGSLMVLIYLKKFETVLSSTLT